MVFFPIVKKFEGVEIEKVDRPHNNLGSMEELAGEIHSKHVITPYSVEYNKLEGMTVQKLFRKEARVHAENDYLGIRPYIEGTDKRV